MLYVSLGISPGSHKKALAGAAPTRIASRMAQAARRLPRSLAGGAESNSLSSLSIIATAHGGFRCARPIRAALPIAPYSNSTPFAGEA